MASTIRLNSLVRTHPWRDLRYLAVCVIGSVVCAAAAWAVGAGQVPLRVVPADALLAGACGLLAVEWLFAAALIALHTDRTAAVPAGPPAPTPAPAPVVVRPAEVDALSDRVERLTAALTLAANAEDLGRVGTIAQDALAADLRAANVH